MKNGTSKKILAVILAMITLLAAFSLIGCSNEKSLDSTETPDITVSDTTEGSTETDAVTEEDTYEETTKEQVVLPGGVLFDDRKTGHTIVYAKGSSIYPDKTAVQEAVVALQNGLKKNCSIDMEAVGENNYAVANPNMTGNKVVVGCVEKDAVSVELYESLYTSSAYIIKFVNNSLYIVGKTGEATAAAVDYFVSTYLIRYYTYTLTLEEGVLFEKNAPPALEELTISSNPFEDYVIVHDGTAIGTKRAKELKTMLADRTGVELAVTAPTAEPTELEILVGKVDRPEVRSIRSDFDRPNVYYDVQVVGEKLVCVGEGWYTLGKIVTALGEYLDALNPDNCDLTGKLVSGDMINEIDTTDMLNRAEGTDVRVFNYNTYGTVYDYTQYALFSGEQERGEVIGDIMVAYYPDIITTNEFYVGKALYNAAMTQLSDYYYLLDTSEYDVGYPYQSITGNVGRGNPEQILIRKDSNLTVIDSGWRYFSETDGSVVDFHGVHWAVFQTEAGDKFIITVGHYGDSNTYNGYAREHYAAVEMAQQMSGSSEILPTVIAGDLFSNQGSGAAYKFLVNTCGFKDPQRIKEINRNITERGDVNINQATSHSFGQGRGDGTRIDFILHNEQFTPLKFKVLKSTELNYTSDHYPEVVDLKFTK